MKQLLGLAFVAMAAFGTMGFLGFGESKTDPRAVVEAGNAAFARAVAAKDAAAVAALYTDDAMILPPGAEAMSGHAAITAYFQGMLDSGVSKVMLTTDEAVLAGKDTINEIGHVEIYGADGASVGASKYIVVWHKDGGAWKLHRDIWN